MQDIFYDKPKEFSSYTRADNAKLVFSRIPTFEFYIQRFSLPGITIGTVGLNSRTGAYSRPGENLQFEKPLNVEIILDENYKSLQEIYNWITSYADPDDDVVRDFDEITSDARIVILNNEKTEEVGTFHFENVYPTSISSLSYSFTEPQPAPLKFSANFEYTRYTVDFSKKSVCTI